MSAPLHITPAPLTVEAFAPFGDVIEIDGAERIEINQGTTERFHALSSLDVSMQGGAGILSIFRATARPAPIKLQMMERHPLGSQAFFPLSPYPWLVVVCADETPTPGALRAFWARGDQGVQYAKNIWHHPLLIIEAKQDFLVADRDGPGDNLQEIWFEDGAFALLETPDSAL